MREEAYTAWQAYCCFDCEQMFDLLRNGGVRECGVSLIQPKCFGIKTCVSVTHNTQYY